MAEFYQKSADGVMAPQDPEEQRLIEEILRKWSQVRVRRYNFEVQMQEAALLIWPEYANTFFYGYDQWPGMKKTTQQVDSTGMLANVRFGAIVDSLLTPFTSQWSKIQIHTSDKKLMAARRVKEYFGLLSECLWTERYQAWTNFQAQNQQNYQCLGAFGNMNMFIDELDGRNFGGAKGLQYRSVSPGEMYYVQNHQGIVNAYFRAFRRTALNAHQTPGWRFPEALRPALELGSSQLYWFIQYVTPRSDYQPWRVDAKGKRWASYVISMEGHCLVEESGYNSFPMAIGRYTQAPDEEYGRGPAFSVLPSLKTLNAKKAVGLKLEHRAADPVYLIGDDGLIDFKVHPGAQNKGGVTKDGKSLVVTLPTGNYEVNKESRQEEVEIIKDAFLVSLFEMAWKNPNVNAMSARQVVEFINDRGMLLAPTVGRQYSEYLGTMHHRELDILARLGKLPKVPPELIEAKGEYKVVYTSPLARAMRAQASGGFMRLVEMIKEIVASSGNPAYWDVLDFDLAIPEMAEDQAVPERWITAPDKLLRKQNARAQAAQQDAQIKSLPAQAAMVKAQAISQKAQAGQGTQGLGGGLPSAGGQVGQPGPAGPGSGQPGQPNPIPTGMPQIPG